MSAIVILLNFYTRLPPGQVGLLLAVVGVAISNNDVIVSHCNIFVLRHRLRFGHFCRIRVLGRVEVRAASVVDADLVDAAAAVVVVVDDDATAAVVVVVNIRVVDSKIRTNK